MIFRNLDANNDWRYGKGKNDYVALNEAIGLNVKTRIQSWLNDCFFALTAGIDWTNRLGTKNQRLLLEADIRRQILQSKDVTGIVSFFTELNGRAFTANYEINTIYSKSFKDSVTLGVFNA